MNNKGERRSGKTKERGREAKEGKIPLLILCYLHLSIYLSNTIVKNRRKRKRGERKRKRRENWPRRNELNLQPKSWIRNRANHPHLKPAALCRRVNNNRRHPQQRVIIIKRRIVKWRNIPSSRRRTFAVNAVMR